MRYSKASSLWHQVTYNAPPRNAQSYDGGLVKGPCFSCNEPT
jgi:hydroxyacyl-ACP dehydratase HTD2-like protein with hotdog domain